MNILEQEDLVKGAPDDLLLQEAQSPSGKLPQFLVVSEIQRRKQMRDRFSAQEQQPQQTVSDQILAEAAPQMPPQGIGALQPQMQQQMPPEMMAAQAAPMAPQPQMMAAGGGRMPYRRMAGGGIVPPNSLVEDASKFDPQNLYDMDASQMAMANPTNMGIASVLPMAAGGVVRMQQGQQVPFVSTPDNSYLDDHVPQIPLRGLSQEEIASMSEEELGAYNNSVLDLIESKGLIPPPKSNRKDDISLLSSLDLRKQYEPEYLIKNKVPVLDSGKLNSDNLGINNIFGLETKDQDSELREARESLTGLMGQKVEAFDPTDLLLKSQERADKRAISEALIAFGAGIARGDIASGLEGAGKSVSAIRNKEEALSQQLKVRRGEAEVQSQKDKIARDIAIVTQDISAIKSDEDRKDKLVARKIQYQGLLLEARRDNNNADIKQFTAELASNKSVQDIIQFNQTLDANFSQQEQLNYRARLAGFTALLKDEQQRILREAEFGGEDGQSQSWEETNKELTDLSNYVLSQLSSLKQKDPNNVVNSTVDGQGSGNFTLLSTSP